MSKERGLICTGESVRAFLAGRKTQTRRVIKPQPIGHRTCWSEDLEAGDLYIETDESVWKACESTGRNKRAAGELTPVEVECPYGVVGDRLYVRESYTTQIGEIGYACGRYNADAEWFTAPNTKINHPTKKLGMVTIPSIHMPKWATRIWLEITGIRVEKIQSITTKDILREGIIDQRCGADGLMCDFATLWDSLNTKRDYSWERNPFVWVIEFKRGDGES